jgi:hypothetical protein
LNEQGLKLPAVGCMSVINHAVVLTNEKQACVYVEEEKVILNF